MTDADGNREYGPGDPRQYIALIPGGGWMIGYGSADTASVPVAAWALQADGQVVALEPDSSVAGLIAVDPAGITFWHPASSVPGHRERRHRHELRVAPEYSATLTDISAELSMIRQTLQQISNDLPPGH